ncbi:MAG: hypothetical protein ACXAE3_07595 [Candidatus Kariarchaeaceae archaeon]|jgi:hypothetical protein
MVVLDYLIIYTNTGIPIYSYKFKKSFEISDDLLFSAFLASLNQFSQIELSMDRPSTIVMEDEEVNVEYSDEFKLSTLEIDQTILIFYYSELESITVGVGISKDQYGAINTLFSLTQLMVEIEQFVGDYNDLDWTDLDKNILKHFESRLHLFVIHKFLDAHTAQDHCYLNNACPFRRGTETEPVPEKSLGKRLRTRFGRN